MGKVGDGELATGIGALAHPWLCLSASCQKEKNGPQLSTKFVALKHELKTVNYWDLHFKHRIDGKPQQPGWKSPLTMKGGGTRRKMAMIVNGELDRWVMMWKASRIFMLVNFPFQSMVNGNRFPW
ncbi:hypothetical protein JHK82_036051 [Glycine max]|nr:hypothetical protein JHK86_036239 [Glycine max]KAG5112782.1 hypothetical protein JHK82_036051 [Glycine max]